MSHPPIEYLSHWTVTLHLLTLLLVYSYIKNQLVFPFILTLTPSLLVSAAEIYYIIIQTRGVFRAKYLISFTLFLSFLLCLCQVVKNEGGVYPGHYPGDDQWLVKHRLCFLQLVLAMLAYMFYSIVDFRKRYTPSVVKDVLLNILSSLSMPLTICSGGACNSIYISTITSILSSFSFPLTLVVPILNYLAYGLQVVGLFSIYSANKWRNWAFWLFLAGMLLQVVLPNWITCLVMIVAVLANAKTNKFVYGRKIFKESVL